MSKKENYSYKNGNAIADNKPLYVHPVQSLKRGLKILQKISEHTNGISLKELSTEVSLPVSTVHRLLLTLQQEGFAIQTDSTSRWNIGATAFSVGSAFVRSRELLSIVHPIMRELMLKAGETINLSVLNELIWKAILIGQVECHELMRMVAPIGGELPMHASAAGKLFLSQYSTSQISQILSLTGLEKITEHTHTQQYELQQDLSRIKLVGYAEDREEHATGLYCVAAPIYDEKQQIIATLSISGPKVRISEKRMIELGKLAKQYAQHATDAFRGNL